MSAPVEEMVGPHRPGVPTSSRRRRGLWMGLLVLALVSSLLWWRSTEDDGWPRGYGHWTQDITRGDLADDDAAIASVLAVWRSGEGLTDVGVVTPRLLEAPIDDARVVWISRLDGQLTAVVRQQVELTYDRYHDEDIERSTPGYVFGFMRGGTDGLRIRQVDVEWGKSPLFVTLGAWVSQSPPLALVLDVGEPLRISTAPPTWRADGTYQSPFRRLHFDDDGVAVIRPSTGEDPADLLVGPVDPPQEPHGLLGQHYREGPDPLTTWQVKTEPESVPTVPIARLLPPDADAGVAFGAFAIDGLSHGQDQSFSAGLWVLAGTVEDRFPITIGPYSLDGGRHWRLGLVYGPYGHTRARDAGPLDASAPLPVAVRLPDARGWVIAAPRAELAYRAPGSAVWTQAGAQAALLPDADAWEVRVTTKAGQRVVTPTAARLSP